MRFISKLLSFFFFPLFIPIYGMFLLFSLPVFSYYPPDYIWKACLIIAFFGTLFPFTIILLLSKLNFISELRMTDKKDRLMPYICTAVSYFIGASMLPRLAMPGFVSALLVAVAVALLIDTFISIWWKISAHMTGIGGFLGGILCVSFQLSINPYWWVIAIVLLCGLVASARLYLKAHTSGQVVAGFFNGLICTLVIPNIHWSCWFSLG